MTDKSPAKRTKDYIWKIEKRVFSKDALIFLVFLMLAGGFWFVQSLDKQRETSIRIPVDYMGIPEDIEIESKLPKHISIRIRDEGIALLQYNKRKTIPLALDMDRVYYGKGEFVITADQLKNRLSRYVLPTTALLKIEPDSIHVAYHRLSNALLPIKVKSDISFASQYILSKELQVVPKTVRVFGPENVLDTMKAVYTEKVELRSLSDTTEVQVKLAKSKNGVKYAFNDVTVTALVEMFTESKKEIPVTIINEPDNFHLRIFPPTIQVSYNVGLSNFNNVKDNDIQLVFDYNEAKESKRRRYKLQVINNSQFISNLRISPDEVEFLLEEK
ncbi:MAG: YbbR-like domain-containing protein [Porphyromonadaceae bacterium]|nr:YbbR-like domain-containing protein [Porphyromonadaceae bacterium]